MNLGWTVFSLVLALCHSKATEASVLHRQTSSGSSLKAGLGWGGGGNISQFEGHQVGWYATWAPTSWVTPPPALEYVPQLWGGRDAALFGSTVNASSISLNGIKNILAMNEPQEPSQSNLSPQDAAAMWKTYLEPLKAAGVRLGSPATTSAPNGKTWLQDFLTACDGCSVDFIALHWYGVVATEFISYIEDFYKTFQRPIWVTEWACLNFVAGGSQCTNDEVVQFMKTTQSYMDQAQWVERYAWFGAMANLPAGVPNNFTALMDPSGVINALGQQYIGPPAGSTPPPGTTSISSTAPSTPTTPISSTSAIPTTTLATTTIEATNSDIGTVITTTLITTLSPQSTTSTRSSSAHATTTSAYVIINRASTKYQLNCLAILFSTLLACLSPLF
ncbi:hypothetical protein FRC12_007196 [Ceratobasidium sp. 428]|nr:hypothetical protein FRC12_007196 [Ceratobasidium sp. 428]